MNDVKLKYVLKEIVDVVAIQDKQKRKVIRENLKQLVNEL